MKNIIFFHYSDMSIALEVNDMVTCRLWLKLIDL